MKRSKARTSEALEFAKSERKCANEFASTVYQWLRNRKCLGQKFRREFPIPPYTVDLCCVELKLVIEVDGESHFTEAGIAHDMERDHFLSQQCYQVIRVKGYDVIRDGGVVLQRIHDFVQKAIDIQTPHPRPLSAKRGEGSEDEKG